MQLPQPSNNRCNKPCTSLASPTTGWPPVAFPTMHQCLELRQTKHSVGNACSWLVLPGIPNHATMKSGATDQVHLWLHVLLADPLRHPHLLPIGQW